MSNEIAAQGDSGLINVLLNMPVGKASIVCIILASTFGTGALVVFAYWPVLFTTLAFPKLLLLSFAITSPFIVFGAFILQLGYAVARKRALVEGVGPRVALAAISHSLMAMLAMGVGGFQALIGSSHTMSVSLYWGYSGLYAYSMAVFGFHEAEKKKLSKFKLYMPIAVWAAYFLISDIGDYFGWWHLLFKN